MKRQLLKLQPSALETQLNVGCLQQQERQKLSTGDCAAYLARDSRGAVTLFLALTFEAASEDIRLAKSEYSRSLELEDGISILEEAGVSLAKKTGSAENVANQAETRPPRTNEKLPAKSCKTLL